MSYELIGLSSVQIWDWSDTTYETIMLSYVPNLVLMCSKPCQRGNLKIPARLGLVVRHVDL